MQTTKVLKVYFDGLCPLCSTEIDHYKKKKRAARIEFVDISDSGFSAHKEGLDPRQIHAQFHVKTKEGQIYVGVPAFVEIWKVLQIWTPMQSLALHPTTRPIFELGYALFAKIRPYFRRKENCESHCQKSPG